LHGDATILWVFRYARLSGYFFDGSANGGWPRLTLPRGSF